MNTKRNKKIIPHFTVEFERENDGRWIAEIPKLPGVMAYGATKTKARQKVYVIALRMLADVNQRSLLPIYIMRASI